MFSFGMFTELQLDNYYLYNQFLEIFVLLFCRTRIAIMYLPKILAILNVCFIVYYQTFFYPFSSEALFLLISLTAFTFVTFLKYIECPALDLNPFAYFTPAVDNPRQAYIPVAKSSYSLGFEVWTLFYPPAVRSEFEAEEQETINEALDESMFDFSQGQQRANNVEGGPAENLLPNLRDVRLEMQQPRQQE